MLLKFLRIITAVIPVNLLLRGCGFVGGLARYFAPREVGIARAQIELAVRYSPELQARGLSDPAAVRRLIRQVFVNLGFFAGELIAMPRIMEHSEPRNAELPKFPNIENLTSAACWSMLQKKETILVLTGHLGAFELSSAYYLRSGTSIYAFGRTPNYTWLERLCADIRNSYGLVTIWRNDPRSTAKLFRAIKDGSCIGALIDQDTDLENCFAPFFGVAAASPLAALRLALRFKMRVISSFALRTAVGKWEVSTEPIEYNPNDPDAAVKIMTTFNQRLERLICKYPEQWVWFHRRWRRRPEIDYKKNPEQLRSTPEYLEWLEHQNRITAEALECCAK